MARKAYIMTFDRELDLDFKKLHSDLTCLDEVITWSHYIKSSYILISKTETATELNEVIKQIAPELRYLLLEVNLKNRNGRLPAKAWEWLKAQSLKIIK